MKRLIVKLGISIAAFLFVNIWLLTKGVMQGAADFFISAKVEELILFAFLQIVVIANFLIVPLKAKKQKIIYWCVSEPLVISTFLLWGVFMVGPIWLW